MESPSSFSFSFVPASRKTHLSIISSGSRGGVGRLVRGKLIREKFEFQWHSEMPFKNSNAVPRESKYLRRSLDPFLSPKRYLDPLGMLLSHLQNAEGFPFKPIYVLQI